MVDTTGTAVGSDGRRDSVREVITSPDFKRLVARRWRVSGTLLLLLFGAYYGYVAVLGASPEVMARRIGPATTLGIPIGVGVIAFAFALTAVHVAWANSRYDPEVKRLKDRLKPR
jgi:uncharacterized membrane protein (DUF485 family)